MKKVFCVSDRSSSGSGVTASTIPATANAAIIQIICDIIINKNNTVFVFMKVMIFFNTNEYHILNHLYNFIPILINS